MEELPWKIDVIKLGTWDSAKIDSISNEASLLAFTFITQLESGYPNVCKCLSISASDDKTVLRFSASAS